MSAGLRQSMAWLHTWAGVLPGWVLYFVFLTGTLGYFSVEIDRWMQPELPLRSRDVPVQQLLEQGLQRLQQRAPDAERWTIELPRRKSPLPPRLVWRGAPAADGSREAGSEPLPPGTDTPRLRATGGGQVLYQLHYRLHYLDTQLAYWLIGACAMVMLVSILTGIVIHKKIFTDFFTFRPGAGQRSWRDLHTVLGTVALPFHLLITWSGLVLLASTYQPLVVDEVYRFDEAVQDAFFIDNAPRLADQPRSGVVGALLPVTYWLAADGGDAQGARLVSFSVRNPGDANARVVLVRERRNGHNGTDQRVYGAADGRLLDPGLQRAPARQVRDALVGLHKGGFAAPLLRGLYGVSGVVGTLMVAAGMVYWAAKRRARRATPVGDGGGGLAWVERANPAMLLGPLLGVCVYLLANRLLPLELPSRGAWEVHALFTTWGVALVGSLALRPQRAWLRLWQALAVVAALVPLVNGLTSDRHLGITVPWALQQGDWVLAGIDVSLLGVALVAGLVARHLSRRTA